MTSMFIDRSEVISEILVAISNNRIISLSGHAGIGKSTICKIMSENKDKYASEIFNDIDYLLWSQFIDFYDWQKVKNKLIIIDEYSLLYIDDVINKASENNRIVLVTRNEIINIPKVIVSGLNREQSLQFLSSLGINDKLARSIVDISNGSPMFLQLFSHITEQDKSFIQTFNKNRKDKSLVYVVLDMAQEYQDKGDYLKATQWYKWVLDFPIWNLSLSEKRMILTNLGNIYFKLGYYYEANHSYKLVLEELTVDDEIIATTYNNLARVYQAQGDYERALEFYSRALIIYKKVLGKEHRDIATTYNNIAGVYQVQGYYIKALEFYNRALMIYEKVLGTEHSDTATTYNNIAGVYQVQGDYAKALEFYSRALMIYEKVFGVEHPDTAAAYNNIGGIYDDRKDYLIALEWYYKALAITEKVLGKEHPSTATIYNNIASVCSRLGDYSIALEWYFRTLAISEKILGKEHFSTAMTYNNIAGIYSYQGDYLIALKWYHKALSICEKILGEDHPSTATIYNNIAGIYSRQGEYNMALDWYLKAYESFLSKFGEGHPNFMIIKENIQKAYKQTQNDTPFDRWIETVLSI